MKIIQPPRGIPPGRSAEARASRRLHIVIDIDRDIDIDIEIFIEI